MLPTAMPYTTLWRSLVLAVDTNVLVYAADADSQLQHGRCQPSSASAQCCAVRSSSNRLGSEVGQVWNAPEASFWLAKLLRFAEGCQEL
jgi:hypothetical protein